MRTATILCLCLILASTLVAPPPAGAGELAGVTLPDTAQAGGEQLVLNGMGLRKKAIFKVYVAGLYLPEKQGDAGAILAADAPRRMVMEWVRTVGPEPICDGWIEGLAANTPDASAEVRRQFDVLCTWMEEMKSGDQHVFTYLPGEGTEVKVRGQKKGVLEGKAFADALFACWIGPKPGPGEDFKNDLLGK